jgi:hypothetical protein
MSSMWGAIVAIVAIVMTAQTMQAFARSRSRNKADDADVQVTQERIDALEERIRVLERIVTEDKRDLRREISRL